MRILKEKPEKFIASQSFEIDGREAPGRFDRQHFKAGWRHAGQGMEYNDEAMKTLTWQNLGYRLGTKYGEQTQDGIYKVFKKFVKHWKKSNKRKKFVIF